MNNQARVSLLRTLAGKPHISQPLKIHTRYLSTVTRSIKTHKTAPHTLNTYRPLAQSTLSSNVFHQRRNLFIQTEETPNDNALKFLPSMSILPEGETVEYLSGREAFKSPIARKLFGVDGVKSVMFGEDFITVQKKGSYSWMVIKPEVFSILTECLTSGEVLFDPDMQMSKDTDFDENDDDVVAMIKELVVTRIRPAIQEDGGDIDFVEFQEDTGTVILRLRGACRSCDSSSVTLKNGIESMLMHYIEEVQEVKQIEEDEEDEEDSHLLTGLNDPLLAIKNKRNAAAANAGGNTQEQELPPNL